jgi:hypothetical protein
MNIRKRIEYLNLYINKENIKPKYFEMTKKILLFFLLLILLFINNINYLTISLILLTIGLFIGIVYNKYPLTNLEKKRENRKRKKERKEQKENTLNKDFYISHEYLVNIWCFLSIKILSIIVIKMLFQ